MALDSAGCGAVFQLWQIFRFLWEGIHMSTEPTSGAAVDVGPVPKDWLPGLAQNWKSDLMSGFVLSLIALPLCLGIAIASNAPPIAGIIAGFVGGMLAGFLSGSHLTINGPAAGLIVIVLGAVAELGGGDPVKGFQYTTAVCVVVGAIQIISGFLNAGKLTNFFNLSVIHGMLAGIGIIIILKMFHVMIGMDGTEVIKNAKGMLGLITAIPYAVTNIENYMVAMIGGLALLIMAVWPMLPKIVGQFIPAPLVLAVLGLVLATSFSVDEKYLLTVPLDFFAAIKFPDFSMILTPVSLKYIFIFLFVASLESLLTASAIDKQDPWNRQSDMNKEFIGKGVGNMVSASIGGLPMIAEVVRSAANIMNGARTRWSNFFHGTFLLVFVLSIPAVLNMIPVAALAGMLVFIGFRLAHPKEFAHVLHIGKEEFLYMLVTALIVAFVDLLAGVFIGTALAMFTNMIRGVPISRLFTANTTVETQGDNIVFKLQSAAGFHSFMNIRSKLDAIPAGQKVAIDFSEAGFIDHTVHERLHDFKREYELGGGNVTMQGTENHTPYSSHRSAALVRKR